MESTRILKRIFLVFGIAFIIVMVLILMYGNSFRKMNDNTRLLIHNLEVLDNTEELLGLIKDMEAGTRGYALTNNEKYLAPFKVTKAIVPEKIRELKVLLKDNPKQQSYLDTIANLIDRKIDSQNFIIHLKKSDNFKFGYQDILAESSSLMDSIKIIAAKMKFEEERWRIYRSMEGSDTIMNTKILSTIFSATALIIMLISLFYILLEIRSKRKVQDLLAAVLQASQSAILSFKAIRQPDERISDFLCLQCNRIGAAMTANPEADLVGRTMIDIFPDSLSSGLLEAYIKVVNEGNVYKTERYYPDNNGGKWYQIVAVKLEDGITVTYDDISKEKEYEVALQKYIVELERSNNELEQFAFVASHDLQEPLRKIQSFGDRLNTKARSLLTDETGLYMDKMLSAATRMSGLISDLLNFSRLVKVNDEFVPTDLNKIMQDVFSDMEIVISQKQAIVTCDNLPVVQAVSSQMYQLFFNLVGNALKFSRNGVRPEIKITSELITIPSALNASMATHKMQKKVRITFADNGIGFDPKYTEKIFVIFQRLHGKHAYEGTGIGLAICKRIVSNHNGEISATAVPGGGAVFKVEIPLSQHT